jgi:non-canonical purine NTP pyrophosphatase (RdgB/HAM1 family)
MNTRLSDSVLLIASHNEGKVAEIRAMVALHGLRVRSAAEAGLVEPEETGDSFFANAELKAVHAHTATGLTSLADDSGLVVPALGGDPGVYSARWAGPGKDFSLAFARIREGLSALGLSTAEAYFQCVLCLKEAGGTHFFEGRLAGSLVFPPRGEHGFGYDPIFIPTGHQHTLAELPAEVKNSISHRGRAFASFIDFLKS